MDAIYSICGVLQGTCRILRQCGRLRMEREPKAVGERFEGD